MPKPTVNLNCVANHYASPNERIIEIGNGIRSADKHKACLISIVTLDDGRLFIAIYRGDEGMVVRYEEPTT